MKAELIILTVICMIVFGGTAILKIMYWSDIPLSFKIIMPITVVLFILSALNFIWLVRSWWLFG